MRSGSKERCQATFLSSFRTDYALAINRKAAEMLGLANPAIAGWRADKVIE